MRMSIPTMNRRWPYEEMPDKEDEVLWAGRESGREDSQDRYETCEEEDGEFDHFEPQSPETPASSPCPPSPTTPSSSTFDYYSNRSSFSSTTCIAKIDSPAANVQIPLSIPTTGSRLVQTSAPKPTATITDLPPELLRQIFKYTLDERSIYDYMEEYDDTRYIADDNRATWGQDGDAQFGFELVRVEVQLSQVCRWWREVMRTVNLWKLGDSFRKCIHITAEQWFNPSFPFHILEGREGYHFINITFSGFTLPPEYFRPTNTLFDAPLFDEPEGSNFHDEMPPRRPVVLDVTTYIRLKLNSGSNVAIDKVLGNINFIDTGSLRIIITVNSESRFFVSERCYTGSIVPLAPWDQFANSRLIYKNLVTLGFEINSWLRDKGKELGCRIGDISRWFNPVCEDYESLGLHVKLPKLDGIKRKGRVPKVGWQDRIAQIFSSHSATHIGDDWEHILYDQGMLCDDYFDVARLDSFVDDERQLEFTPFEFTDCGEPTWESGPTRKDEMLLLVRPFNRKDGKYGYLTVNGYDLSG